MGQSVQDLNDIARRDTCDIVEQNMRTHRVCSWSMFEFWILRL